ncbi:Mismatch repair endonuclease pms2 [Linnemannia zychae]|nr:Mismatch repair endonuclease pms2 [Linnemannia zychae]
MATANAIKPIDKESVHRICSGQVVLDMATAVKELLENSLDAGSTSIVIKFKQNGLEYITVTDNGCGITDANLDTLALKHYTSKLNSFNDLAKVRSFGFRGEALSSLCALAQLTVTTSTGDSPTGVLVEYNSDGIIQSKTPAPMTKGTIVKISNLFEGMPVRRSEFVKNIKREYNKCIGLIQAYALIATNVRISCVSQVDKKPAVTYIATSGNATVRQNIINVFGPKSMSDLIDFELTLVEGKSITSNHQSNEDEEEDSGISSQGDNERQQDIILIGHISSPSLGKGRSSTDRQYLFINGRPCNLPKIARVINEVYHSFNTNQSPFLVANLILPTAAYDVNVSPDKRTIFLHNERRIVEELRDKLTELFEPSRSTFAVSEARQLIKKPDLSSRLKSSISLNHNDDDETVDGDESMEMKHRDDEDEYLGIVRDHSIAATLRDRPTARVESITPSSFSKSSVSSRLISDTATAMATRLQQTSLVDVMCPDRSSENRKRKAGGDTSGSEDERDDPFKSRIGQKTSLEVRNIGQIEDQLNGDQSTKTVSNLQAALCTNGEPPSSPLDVLETYDPLDDRVRGEEESVSDSEEEQEHVTSHRQPTRLQKIVVLDSEVREDGDREWIEVGFDLDEQRKKRASLMKILKETRRLVLERKTLREKKIKSQSQESKVSITTLNEQPEHDKDREKEIEETQQTLRRSRRLRSQKLSDASFASTDDNKAQQSLSRVISKADFGKMKILGQFNKAFIVARLDNYASNEQNEDHAQQLQGERQDHLKSTKSKHRHRRKVLISSDIFVIDQHASDEKYNFETLQAKTIFSTQRLFQPKKLHLTAQEEITVVDHMRMLNMNGFYLDYDPQAQVSHRLQLVTLPVSEKVIFDLQDFEELVFLLSQQTASSYGSLENEDIQPGYCHKHKLHSPEDKMIRCSKVRALFASRACRRSVMIGHVLNHAQMKRIVRHMGEIDQPWNCPHGRPTMRHLLDLAELEMQEKRARHRQLEGPLYANGEEEGEEESRILNLDRSSAFDPIAVKRPTRHQGSLFKQFLATRNIHDQGSKHKENVERFLREQNQRGRDKEIESARLDKQMEAIEKAAMRQYELDVEAGLVQPSAAMKTGQKEKSSSTSVPPPQAKSSELASTGLLKTSTTTTQSSEPTSNSRKEKEEEKEKAGTGANSEPVATEPVKKIRDETIGQPGEWQTVETPVRKTPSQQSTQNRDNGLVINNDDEDEEGNPEDLKRFKIVEKTYPVDDDSAGEDNASAGSAVFKKRKGGGGKPRNIRRKL